MNSYLQKTIALREVGPLKRRFISPLIGTDTAKESRESLHVDFSVTRELPGKDSKNFDRQKSFWLVSQKIDLLFVCGVAPWIAGCLLILLTGAGGSIATPKAPQQALMIAFVVASLLIGESHQFTSIIRYYSAFRKRAKPYKFARVPFWITYALIAEIILVFTVPALSGALNWTFIFWMLLLQICEILFPVVLLHHVCAQACSVIQMYCAHSNYKFGRAEKGVLAAYSYLLIATGACSIATPFTTDGLGGFFFGVSSPSTVAVLPILYGGSVAFALFIAAQMTRRGFRTNDWPPLGAAVLLLNLTLFILLPVPLDAMRYSWLFVPLLFHATQHWAVAWYTQKKEQSLDATSAQRDKNEAFVDIFAPTILVTLFVLFLPMILTNTKFEIGNIQALFSGETLSVQLSMFVFYMHYFADRVVWRSRN